MKKDKVHEKGSGEKETARAKNKLGTDVDREEIAGRSVEHKVSLQDGRVAMVTVKYNGEKV